VASNLSVEGKFKAFKYVPMKSSTLNPVLQVRAIKTILFTGFLAGTLDAFAAIVVYQADPLKLFQFIASAAFGNEAFAGGTTMVLWGVLFHYFIACFWTLLFFIIYPRISLLWQNILMTGLIYGIVIWLCMNLVVLPLSKISQGPFDLSQVMIGMLILMIMVGLPIALMAHRYYRQQAF
jgi:hypothetical protein